MRGINLVGLGCFELALLVMSCSSSTVSGGSSSGGVTASGTGAAAGHGAGGRHGQSGGFAGGTGSGGQTASGGGGSAGSGGSAELCDTNDIPADAVFVASGALAGDGSRLRPFGTIAAGLQGASALGKKRVVLRNGTYAESVEFAAAHSGVFVEGGYRSEGASWSRDCEAGVASRTVIASPGSVGVSVSGLTQTAGLMRLTVTTAAKGKTANDLDGESVYGVRVIGKGQTFRLEDVVVEAGAGGDGGAVTQVPSAPETSACDRVNDCSATDPAVPGVGAPGSAVAAGRFEAQGYVPTAGSRGAAGPAGKHGKKGTANSLVCRVSCSCRDTVSGCQQGCGSCSGDAPRYAWGQCGCGGLGGLGGFGGRAGGASVAVFASGANTVVALVRSALRSSDGGAGTAGGAGGPGGPGAPGALGSAVYCPESCGTPAGCPNAGCGQQGTWISSGAAGGMGVQGGKGGPGGGGSGGPSFTLVAVSGASVLPDPATTVAFGAAGKGASGSAAGEAGIRPAEP
jgi:hypothetical protein